MLVQNSPMRILVTGSSGQIGWELMRAFGPEDEVLSAGRPAVDFTDFNSIRTAIRETRPQVIINAAGYTAVDQAEAEPALAMRINAEAVAVLADEARRCGAAVVHYSTDYVFDGRKGTPYSVEDEPSPLSVYGRSKLAGERAIATSGAKFIILRTCWVYAMRGRNFVLAILKQARAKPELRVVSDQIGSPTWARSIAHGTAQIIRRSAQISDGQCSFAGHEGLYHLSCGGVADWFTFARHILELYGIEPAPNLVPITSAEYGAAAARPQYSVLDCSRTGATFGVWLPHWTDALAGAMSERHAFAESAAGSNQGS